MFGMIVFGLHSFRWVHYVYVGCKGRVSPESTLPARFFRFGDDHVITNRATNMEAEHPLFCGAESKVGSCSTSMMVRFIKKPMILALHGCLQFTVLELEDTIQPMFVRSLEYSRVTYVERVIFASFCLVFLGHVVHL